MVLQMVAQKTVHPVPMLCSLVCLSYVSVTLVYCDQMVGWIKMPHGTDVGLGPGDSVRWRPSSSPQKGHSSPQFLAHVCCGQMAGWIKMPLGMKVGLGQGTLCYMETQLPAFICPERGTAAPHFSVYVCCATASLHCR